VLPADTPVFPLRVPQRSLAPARRERAAVVRRRRPCSSLLCWRATAPTQIEPKGREERESREVEEGERSASELVSRGGGGARARASSTLGDLPRVSPGKKARGSGSSAAGESLLRHASVGKKAQDPSPCLAGEEGHAPDPPVMPQVFN
jgi:hypothetical protein